METVTLNNGVEMPLIGFGTWALTGRQCEACVAAALEEGYRMPFTQGKKQIFAEPLLCELSKTYGKSVAQLALRYLVQRGIPVIPKSAHRERMRENLKIFDFSISRQDMERIRSLDEGRSLFGFWG